MPEEERENSKSTRLRRGPELLASLASQSANAARVNLSNHDAGGVVYHDGVALSRDELVEMVELTELAASEYDEVAPEGDANDG